MREVTGDLWSYHAAGHWVVITTNGSVRKDGCAVMGRGVAWEAAQKFPGLPAELGRCLTTKGNVVFDFPAERLLTLPVKHLWMQSADIRLVVTSIRRLVATVAGDHAVERYFPSGRAICLVRPGCGNGGLQWERVRAAIAPLLDDRFLIVERAKGESRRPV